MTSAAPSARGEHTLPQSGSKISIRRLQTHDEYRACVLRQEEAWGKGFPDLVPTSILMVNQKIGGVTAGAFDEHNSMIGFVFGMTGYKNGELVHWSDVLAVRQEFRGKASASK